MTELLHSKGVRALREAIAAGSVTIAGAVQQAFDAAQRSQAQLHAFIYLPEALAVNHRIDHGIPGSSGESPAHAPLAGVPVAVKDLIDTADMPTALGSPAYAGRRPQHDAWVVQRLRAAGATVLGKTVTTEFAWRHPGATTNPWHHGHTPGGSSSGSAAAVGAGIVPLALGTQTYGSVIRPAAYCGVVGMKPTYGTIARTGVLPLAGSLDHLGLFANSVGDIAYVLPLLAGTDDGDPHGFPSALNDLTSGPTSAAATSAQAARGFAGAGYPRIGVLQQQIGGAIEPAQQQALDALAGRLKADGAELVNVELPGEMANAQGLAWTLLCVEAALTHRELFDRTPELMSAVMRELIEEGRRIPATDYANAKALQVQMTTRFKRWFTASMGLDALLVAPASGEAPRGLDYTGDAAFCTPWTLLGVPAINLPIGFGPAGLPLGAQLIGALGDDVALLSVAAWVEARTGWAHAVQARGAPRL
ncbi:amidase [Burkholderia sp. L27(2015)]|uniref:amidase n=1 Tax=Burkholderia sp. L27(2015) TaxID=1641858 RepID=UPI00131A8F99|nr:amidase [Burkholderia sp. L27(2015)]